MIGLHGSYYDDNFGDLLLIQLFEQWINEKTSDIVNYPLVPESEINKFRVHFPNSSIGLENQAKWKGLIYAGGGHFGQPNKNLKVWNKRFFKRHGVPAKVCKKHKKPYAIFGVGAGPVSDFWVRRNVKQIFRDAKMLSVRDSESEDFVVKKLSLKRKLFVVPDAALTVNVSDISTETLNVVEKLLSPYKGKILIGIHHPRDFLSNQPEAKLMRTALIKSLSSNKNILPVVFADKGDINSTNQCQELQAFIVESLDIDCLAVPFMGVWETIALISKFSSVTTSKLHVGILAYALGVYCQSFAVHPKTPRFYRQINRDDQCNMMHDITEKTAINKLNLLVENALCGESVADAKWKAVKKEAWRHRELVHAFIDAYC